MSRKSSASLAVALAFAAFPSFAQTPAVPPVGPDWSKVEIKATDLGNRTYMLTGQGGNITVALGDDGVIMVDGQFAPLHNKIKAAIETLSKEPIRFLINTHYHGDHTGGNAGFAAIGVTVVAHDNVRVRLSQENINGLTGGRVPPAPPVGLPKQTHSGETTVALKGRSAKLTHPPRAHTDGDTYVYFADANVLATGDIFTSERYPNIDFMNGGTIRGMIAALDAFIAISTDATKVVPGHGSLANKARLMEYHAMLATSRERLLKLADEGKSEADVLALKPLADLDAKWAANDQASRNWMRVVYNSLKL